MQKIDLDSVEIQLSELVDKGLLCMGVNELGDVIFWATALGAQILGMTG